MRLVISLALLFSVLVQDLALAAGQPQIFVTGRLTNMAGEGLLGPVELDFRLYTSFAATQPIWIENHKGVPLSGGMFDVLMGSKTPLPASDVFAEPGSIWVGISVNSEAELPRTPLTTVAYAMQASTALKAKSLVGPAVDLECAGCVGGPDVAAGSITRSHLDPSICQAGQFLRTAATGKSWVCSQDSLESIVCPEGQTIHYLTNKWRCSDDRVLTDEEVNAVVANFGYALVSEFSPVAFNGQFQSLAGIPPGISDGDDDSLAKLVCAKGQLLGYSATGWGCNDSFSLYKGGDGINLTGDTISLKGEGCQTGWVMKRNAGNTAWECVPQFLVGDGLSYANGTLSVVPTFFDSRFVATGAPSSIPAGMLQNNSVTNANVVSVDWSKVTNVPAGFADGIDDGIAKEYDPQVGVIYADKWCTSDGTMVNCAQNQPLLAESDPQVGVNTINRLSVWDGAALIASRLVQTATSMGVGTDTPAGAFQVAGGELRVSGTGVPQAATGPGALYVEGKLEVDGEARMDAKLILNSTAETYGAMTFNGNATFNNPVRINTDLDMAFKKITSVATPVNGSDVANKTYVDTTTSAAVASIPAITAPKRVYSVVLSLTASTYCPAGYTVETVASYNGSSGETFIDIGSSGVLMGVMDDSTSTNTLKASITGSTGVLCSKTYESSSGRPYAIVELFKGGTAASCRSGAFYIPAAHTLGNNPTGRVMGNKYGMFLGSSSSWSYNSSNTDSEGGYVAREWATDVDTICVQIAGVDGDTMAPNGVYPVFIGMKTSTSCPSGWNSAAMTAVDGSDDSFYVQISDAITVAGGRKQSFQGGTAYLFGRTSYSLAAGLCWKYYPLKGAPGFQIRTPASGTTCPTGFMSVAPDSIKSLSPVNGPGYVLATRFGMWVGPLQENSVYDAGYSFSIYSYWNKVSNLFCLAINNVL